MGTVIRVDLRDPRVRALVRGAPAGGVATTLYREFSAAPHGSMEEVPLRLLVLLPLDDQLRQDAGLLAMGLLGMDPAPRTIVALVNPTAGDPSHEPVTPDKVLPVEFAGQADTRFLDLRGSMVTLGHPRFGVSAVGTGPTDRWAAGFIDELSGQLGTTAVFDAVWAGIPDDRPAAIGMRLVGLGAGRNRAIADVALRLAKDLRADGEPALGQALPPRWAVDPQLQAPKEPYPRRASARADIPKEVLRACDLQNAGIFEALARTPGETTRNADKAVDLLGSEVSRWTRLFRDAAGRQAGAGGPTVDAAGAAALDAATGGLVFGDPVARAAEDDGDDMVALVGERLELAAGQSGQGLSPQILMDWLRADAESAAPIGPAAVADRLADAERPWATVKQEFEAVRVQPKWKLAPWAGASSTDALLDDRMRGVDPDDPRARPKRFTPAWHLPRALGMVAGTPVWRTALSRFLYVLLVIGIVSAAGLQVWADATGQFLVNAGALGVGLEPWRTIGRVLAIAAVAYLLLGVVTGWLIRRWARQFDFERIPELLVDLDAEACAFAVSDVARCIPRREGARVARAAADTLEQGIALGAATAEAFGHAVDPGPGTPDEDDVLPPYRKPIATPGHTAATDAAGIYRLYPHYVAALRRSFASSLVDAIHTQWPRVRGMFWEDTANLIATSAARSLRHRLDDFHRLGIWQGELARQLADELWSDPSIRAGAVAALDFVPDEPIAMLGAPSDRRLLDINEEGAVVLAIPPQLELVMGERIHSSGARLITGESMETATLLRVFPFQPGLYSYSEADPGVEADARTASASQAAPASG